MFPAMYVITTAHSCGDVEPRKGFAKTDMKL